MTLELSNIRFRYPNERFQFQVREFSAREKETIAVVGPSGCGKTTMLRLIAGILRPLEGTLNVLGNSLGEFNDHQLQHFRISKIGLVFQEFELLDYLSARDNILLPFHLTTNLDSRDGLEDRLKSLAEETGITSLLDSFPNQLSQGERQRVAICRALITQPELLLADEPTGSLDPDNQQRIVDLLIGQAKAQNATLIMVTHDHQLLDNFDRTVNLPALMS